MLKESPIIASEGFAVCLNIYLTSFNDLSISFNSDNKTEFTIEYQSYNYINDNNTYSLYYLKFHRAWHKIVLTEKKLGWMHTCLTFDFQQKSISITMDQELARETFLAQSFELRSIKIGWDSWVTYILPEMFTMVNIFKR